MVLMPRLLARVFRDVGVRGEGLTGVATRCVDCVAAWMLRLSLGRAARATFVGIMLMMDRWKERLQFPELVDQWILLCGEQYEVQQSTLLGRRRKNRRKWDSEQSLIW